MGKTGEYPIIQREKKSITFIYRNKNVKIEMFAPGIVHLSIYGNIQPRKSFAVIEAPVEIPDNILKEDDKQTILKLPGGTFVYDNNNATFLFKPYGKNRPQPLDMKSWSVNDTSVSALFGINGAKNFYGLGEKTLPYNKYGSSCVMWNSDFPAYSAYHDPLYESIPFILKADTHGAYGLFMDNTSRSSFDIGKSNPELIKYHASGGTLEIYLLTGDSPGKVVEAFASLTGRMPMPPIWALGYQQSRWSYYPEERVIKLARDFREKNIPCDVIYLDIDYMNGYRCFTWSPKNFPTPKEMLKQLHADGFKVVTIIDPGIKMDSSYGVYKSGLNEDIFVRRNNGGLYTGQVWPGDCVFPDFLNAKARNWWGEQYTVLVNDGVDGFWNDMNEPSIFNAPNKTFPPDVIHKLDDGSTALHSEVHNVYGMEMARGTREGLEKIEPQKRPFVLTRANYAGGQRFSAMWTGDNFASFAHLKLALAMYLNIGVSGQPFVGSDVGGFVGNPGPELFTRWLELGVFTPLFRTHSVIDSRPREPWAFGREYEDINREVIGRRYALLPEIYTAFHNSSETGLPIIMPLYLSFPEDEKSYEIKDEFIFGNKLLVAPVLDSSITSRSVYLPQGNWFYFYDGRIFTGGEHIVEAPLGKTPIFVKEGNIVFQQNVVPSTATPPDTLIISAYGNRESAGSLYFDDGKSMSYKNGEFTILNLNRLGNEISFNFIGSYKPQYKTIRLILYGTGYGLPKEIFVTEKSGIVNHYASRKIETGALEFEFPFNISIRRVLIK
ncbi:MAG: TIM-barrel domain-containing protein [Candidatus Kryptoniota bacterium]